MRLPPQDLPTHALDRVEALRHPAIFRFGELPSASDAPVASGFAALDRVLNGGWPTARLIEVLCDRVGIGEFSLLLPMMPKLRASVATTATATSTTKSKKSLHATGDKNRALWISQVTQPTGLPCVAYAPALAREGIDLKQLAIVNTASSQQTLWALEQALLSRATRSVFAWIGDNPHDFALRRISLAARKSESLCFLMRPLAASRLASPAELRIAVEAARDPAFDGAIDVALIKRRGLLHEVSLQLQTRALPCLAPSRPPIVLPAPAIRFEKRVNSAASPGNDPLLDSLTQAQKSVANVRERSFINER